MKFDNFYNELKAPTDQSKIPYIKLKEQLKSFVSYYLSNYYPNGLRDDEIDIVLGRSNRVYFSSRGTGKTSLTCLSALYNAIVNQECVAITYTHNNQGKHIITILKRMLKNNSSDKQCLYSTIERMTLDTNRNLFFKTGGQINLYPAKLVIDVPHDILRGRSYINRLLVDDFTNYDIKSTLSFKDHSNINMFGSYPTTIEQEELQYKLSNESAFTIEGLWEVQNEDRK